MVLNKKWPTLTPKLPGWKKNTGKYSKRNDKVNSLKKAVAILERTVSQQNNRLIDLENRSRKNKLLAFVLREQDNESTEVLKQTVTEDVFEKVFGVNVTSVERINELKQKRDEANRPVMTKFFYCNENNKILKNSKI